MKSFSSHNPNDELQAGHALSDLSVGEWEMWRSLAKEQGIAADAELEWISLQLEIDAAMKEPEVIPASLVATLQQQIRPAVAEKSTEEPNVVSLPPRSRHNPWWGWAVAACLAMLLVLQSRQTSTPRNTAVPLELSKTVFVQEAPDLLRLPMSGTTGAFAQARGEVLWSDQRQQGYLVLSDLPVNDPRHEQYQLWIVDPKRDEIPVDGGVFDVPTASTTEVIIEIHAKLNIREPQAFVITLEQSGGVVRSKQEKVVGVAKK